MTISPRQRKVAVLAIAGILAAVSAWLVGGRGHPLNPVRVAGDKVQLAKATARKPSRHRKMDRRHQASRAVQAEDLSRSDALPVQFPSPTKITIALTPKPEFVKLEGRDRPLSSSATKWLCVQDRSTGLVWEAKTHDRGLRDAQNFYSWFDPRNDRNGGYAGSPNHGKCRGGIACDTHAYVQAVNRMKLCGYSDWRLPTRAELSTLVQYSTADSGKGMIDTRFFPAEDSDWYWSADSDRGNPKYAWYVLYYNGRELKASKAQPKRIRLVRGAPWSPVSLTAQRPASGAAPEPSLVAARNAARPLAREAGSHGGRTVD